jgi:hypothetical protein
LNAFVGISFTIWKCMVQVTKKMETYLYGCNKNVISSNVLYLLFYTLSYCWNAPVWANISVKTTTALDVARMLFDTHGSVHHGNVYGQLKVQLDVHVFICILYSSLFLALHVSGAICTHPQEHINCSVQPWVYVMILVC